MGKYRKLLKMVKDNLLTRWVLEETRLREDELSRLDPVFSKNVEFDEGVRHDCASGKSDHELLEMKTFKEYEY